MQSKRGVGGMIKLLKFDNDDSLDPKTLFEGAKITMKSLLTNKPSFKEG